MAQEKITLSVRPRGKPITKLPEEITVTSSGPTASLYTVLAQAAHTSPHRLRITKGSDGSQVPSSPSLLVQSTGLRHQSTIYVKDLGPQIAWRTVFLVEYLGPLTIHPVTYLTLSKGEGSQLQRISLAIVVLHFLKRELETLFVHRFSAATMPAFNILKNSAHYWLLSGLNMAYWIYRSNSPISPSRSPAPTLLSYVGLALFAIGELGNLSTHLTLRNLRSSGSTERGIPQGWSFELVTCPNYMFETVAWVGIALVSWSWATVLFAVVAVAQMGVWAGKKEGRYRKEMGGKYRRKRYVMLPGIW